MAILQVVTSTILLMLYSATYIRLQVGSKYPLISRLTLMLLVSNLFTLLVTPSEIRIYIFDTTEEGENLQFWVFE